VPQSCHATDCGLRGSSHDDECVHNFQNVLRDTRDAKIGH